jgi:hypothetical protein
MGRPAPPSPAMAHHLQAGHPQMDVGVQLTELGPRVAVAEIRSPSPQKAVEESTVPSNGMHTMCRFVRDRTRARARFIALADGHVRR